MQTTRTRGLASVVAMTFFATLAIASKPSQNSERRPDSGGSGRSREGERDAPTSTTASGSPGTGGLSPQEAMQRARQLCEDLTRAGVARRCEPPTRAPCIGEADGCAAYALARFAPVGGFAQDQCTVRVARTAREFHMNDGLVEMAPAGDFPQGFTTEPKLFALVVCLADHDTPWDLCREASPVDVCAKRFPNEYARYKALHEAARRAFDAAK